MQIGIKKSPKELKKLIALRLNKRMKGIIKEVWSLRGAPKQSRVSFKRLEELGLEYRYVAQYIQGKLTYQQMQEKLQIESEHFAKRQMTWFKRDAKIHWVTNQQQTEKLVRKFIKK